MHTCHPAMRTYLADLEARHGLPIRYQRWTSRYEDRQPFRREIEIAGPPSALPSTLDLPYKGEVRQVEVVHFLPQAGERVELSHGDSGYPVAAIEGRRVTLAFDLERLFEAPPEDLQPGLVLQAVLDAALPKAIDNIRDYKWEAEAARFVEWSVQGIDSQLGGWRQAIRDNDCELDRLATATANLVRKNGELREQIRMLAEHSRMQREELAKAEFRALAKMVPDPVASLDFDHSRLVVVLQPITIEYDGVDYEMGRFTLQISTDTVRIWADRGLRYPHPHVSSDAIPCWGNLGPSIAKLLGERQYAALVAACVEFLKSYNERDAYRRIEVWDPDWSEDE